MIKVYNLLTGEEQYYTCNPRQAVRNAYALENNLAAQLALGKLDHLEVLEGKLTVSCGDWVARKINLKKEIA